MENLKIKVTNSPKVRLDKYLSDVTEGFSRSQITKLIEEGNILINGKLADKKLIVSENDEIEIFFEPPKELEAVPQNIPLDIVYEDKDLLIVNKARGMVVHPAAGNYEGTLVNALLYHCKDSLSGINGVIRPGIVHRIDKNTSGLLMVAKNDAAHIGLSQQIKEHSFKREYAAIIHGCPKTDSGTINAPIGRHRTDRKKMTVTMVNSKRAVTHFSVIEKFDKYTYVKCVLETGRTHQIRVHMSSIGCPVLGDDVYGRKTNEFGLEGQCLFAQTVGFVHPITGEYLEFSEQLPDYFENILKSLRREKNA
ncbi:MAG: RluA family pseudouridine synthase [Ruminococcaceae bacterium]|nr:RluA family pseudouridine synthase [Oscillospiraceae bacterium]